MKQEKYLREAFASQNFLEVYVYGLLQDWSLAKDAVQEAYIKFGIHWESVEFDKIQVWLKKTAYRKALDIRRSRHRLIPMNEDLLAVVEQRFEQFCTNQRMHENEQKEKALEQCLRGLKEESLKLVNLYYTERQSCEQMSAIFEKSANALRIKLMRTREKLRECMKRKLGARQ